MDSQSKYELPSFACVSSIDGSAKRASEEVDMFRSFLALFVISAIFLVACSGDDRPSVSEGSSNFANTTIGKGSTGGAPALGLGSSAPAQDAGPAGSAGSATTSNQLQTAQRQVISRANISLEVQTVNPAIAQIRTIAESLGGFIENMNSSGGLKQQQANATIRVPQTNFFTALERIEALGKVLGRNVTTEDVSESFIDLDARLKSAKREEESLLSLLAKAQAINDVLTIERELNRVRADIEKLQGQLNFLQRRVDLSTISVTLQQSGKIAEPPSAALEMEVSDVPVTVQEIRALTSVMKGVVDNVITSTKDGKTTASVTLRVFSEDFNRTLTAIEDKGDVDVKEVREGKAVADSVRPDEPDALIAVSMTEDISWLPKALAIGGVAAGIVLLAGIGLYFGVRASKK